MRALRLGAATAAIGTGLWPARRCADAPPPSYPPGYTPAYAPTTLTYDWTGIYVGGHVGAATTRSEWTYTDATTFTVDSMGHSSNGFAGGGHVGLQKQWGSDSARGRGCATLWMDQESTLPIVSRWRYFATSSAKSLLLVTGKFGAAWDNILAYGKAGYALGDVDYRTTATSTGALLTSSSRRSRAGRPASASNTRCGITSSLASSTTT